MTEQEAIEILNNLAVPIHAEAAFDMAVDAQKVCEVHSDGKPETGTADRMERL